MIPFDIRWEINDVETNMFMEQYQLATKGTSFDSQQTLFSNNGCVFRKK